MPLPKPKKKETKEEFISRCMKFMKNEKWKDHKQQLAICFTQLGKTDEALINKLEIFLL